MLRGRSHGAGDLVIGFGRVEATVKKDNVFQSQSEGL